MSNREGACIHTYMPAPTNGYAPTSPSNGVVQPTSSFIAADANSVFDNSTRGIRTSNDVGTFGDVMEAMGLFGAQVCVGTSRYMLSCADKCSDDLHTRKVVLVDEGNDTVESRLLASPSSLQQQQLMGTHQAAQQQRDAIFRWEGGSEMEKNEEAVGIRTQALSEALHMTAGREERVAVPGQQGGILTPTLPRNHSFSGQQQQQPPQHTVGIIHNAHNENTAGADSAPHADFMSIDGHFVTLRQQKNRQKKSKHVPRQIAIQPERVLRVIPPKPKKERNRINSTAVAEQHQQQHQESRQLHEKEHLGDVPELKQTSSLKRVGSTVRAPGKATKKGMGKFFKKMGKAKFMYEV